MAQYPGVHPGVIVGAIFGGVMLLVFVYLMWRRRVNLKKANASTDMELGGVAARPRADPNVAARNITTEDPELPSYHRDETPSLFKIVASIAASQRTHIEFAALHLLLTERLSKLETLITDLDVLLASAPVEGHHPESQAAQDLDQLRAQIMALIGSSDEKLLPPPKGKIGPTTNQLYCDTDAWYGRLLGIASFATTFATTISKPALTNYDTTLRDFRNSLTELREAVALSSPSVLHDDGPHPSGSVVG